MRTTNEVAALLHERYDGPTKEVDGFTYIPWPDVVRQLNGIFDGPANWSAEPISFTANPVQGLYTTAIKLTVRVLDETTGEIVEFSRPGISTSVAQASKAEREQGLTISQSPKSHETAADGSASLALVKASKLLGNAFGLYLYNKDEQRSKPSGGGYRQEYTAQASAPRQDNRDPSAKARSQLSEKQVWSLINRAGVSEAQLDAMTYAEAKAALDGALGNKQQAAPAGRGILD